MRSENEKGYALLVVLFMIVLILTVSAIFIRGSLSNAMQEHRVDESHLTVMTAEAGVDYTKHLLINEYFARKQELDDFAEDKISSAVQNKKQVNYDEVHNEMKGILKGHLEKRIVEEKLSANHGKFIDPYSYKLIESTLSNGGNPREIIFSGTIEGKGPRRGSKVLTKKITIKQSFLIPDYRGSTNPGGDVSVVPPNMHKLYPDNVSASNCISKNGKLISPPNSCKGLQNGGYKDIQNFTVYFPSGFNSPNGNINVNNSTLFSKGTLEIDNFNNLTGSDLNIDGNFKTKNMNNIKNSSLKINGSVGITGNIQNMINSTIVIRGSAHLNGHLTINDNSMVCVTGSLQIDKQLKIGQGSKLVHWGSLVAYGGKTIAGEIIQVNSENEVWEKCNMKNGNGNSIVWTKPTLEDVTYE